MCIKKIKIPIYLFCLLFLFSEENIAGEKSTYNFRWLDQDKEVYVLQNRKFRKDKRLHLSAGYGFTTTGAFVDATSLQGRFGFFFTEEIGLELMYAKNSGEENDTFKSVQNDGKTGSTPFKREVDNYMAAMFVWSPFYAKINTFNKIVYVDWMLGAGYAQLTEINNRNSVISGNVNNLEVKETHDSIVWFTGLKFYLTNTFHLRLDLTGNHYQAKKALAVESSDNKKYYNNYDLTLAIGMNLF